MQIVCPFCSLHCDDVVFGGSIKVDCKKATDRFAAAFASPTVGRVGTKRASPEDVAKFAKQRFRATLVFNVVTAGTDLETARQLLSLASDGAIRLWIDESTSAAAWRLATSRDGSVSATIGDIRAHADVVWMIGDVAREHPRIAERISLETKTLLQTESLHAETIAELFCDVRQGVEARMANTIGNARYLAVVLAEDAFVESEAIATAELLAKMIWYLNQTNRAVTVQLDRAATICAMSAWQTNRGMNRLSEDGMADIRIGDGGHETRSVLLQIGGHDPGPSSAEAFLPAATVGVDRAGVITRGDATVTIPLQQIVEREGLKTIAQWLALVGRTEPNVAVK